MLTVQLPTSGTKEPDQDNDGSSSSRLPFDSSLTLLLLVHVTTDAGFVHVDIQMAIPYLVEDVLEVIFDFIEDPILGPTRASHFLCFCSASSRQCSSNTVLPLSDH